MSVQILDRCEVKVSCIWLGTEVCSARRGGGYLSILNLFAIVNLKLPSRRLDLLVINSAVENSRYFNHSISKK